jgi:hypothetical protein
MSRRKPGCPIPQLDGERCKEKTLRGGKFCAKHAKVVTTELVPCTGEAHSNPHIDHCMLCAPRWGTREVLKSIEGSHRHSYKKTKCGGVICAVCGEPQGRDD